MRVRAVFTLSFINGLLSRKEVYVNLLVSHTNTKYGDLLQRVRRVHFQC